MSITTEVYLDHARGLLAVAWPTRRGYTIYSDRGPSTEAYALPAGMVRLQEPPAAPASPSSSAATLQSGPKEAA